MELKSHYNPREHYESNQHIKRVIDLINSGFFCPEDKNMFRPLTDEHSIYKQSKQANRKNSDPRRR